MCKVINLISSESYVRANSRFIKLTNLTIATYTEMLFTILDAVSKKKTFDQTTGVFTISREYIEERTGILAEDQKEADLALYQLGIIGTIDPKNKNKISLNAKRYYELLLDDSLVPEELLSKTAKLSHSEKQTAKTNAIKDAIVKKFGETDETVLTAIRSLVDIYYAKGYVKQASWEPVITQLHACTSDPAGLVEIVNHVIASNFQSIPNAIAQFMDKAKGNATKLGADQKKCSGELDSTLF